MNVNKQTPNVISIYELLIPPTIKNWERPVVKIIIWINVITPTPIDNLLFSKKFLFNTECFKFLQENEYNNSLATKYININEPATFGSDVFAKYINNAIITIDLKIALTTIFEVKNGVKKLCDPLLDGELSITSLSDINP